MEQEELTKELFQLREENKLLQEEKESLYHDRELAGNLGKTLLEQNKELEDNLKEINTEYATAMTRIEELKQENYRLRSQIESDSRTKDFHLYEKEVAKEKLQKEFEDEKNSLQIASKKKDKELHKEIESLNSELDKHVMVEKQLKEKIEQQDEMLEKARGYAKKVQAAEILENEVEEQMRLCAELQLDRDSLLMELNDMKNVKERWEFDSKALRQQLESLNEEMQEKTRQAQTWYNHLQEARTEAGEYKAELDLLKAAEANRNHRNKGNSLFGEVEDKRMELERKYVSMKTEHECLVKTYSITKQHLHKLKNQVATLMQVKGNQADTSQMQRLRQALARKEGEVKMLNEKIISLEKQQEDNSLDSRRKEFHEAFSDFGDKKDYVNFLELQLEEYKKKMAGLKKDLQTKIFLELAMSDKLRNTEAQLHKAECSAERGNSENMKLKLRIEDLKMKLQTAIKDKSTGVNETPKPITTSTMRKTKSASLIGYRGHSTATPRAPHENETPAHKVPRMTPVNAPTSEGPKLTASAKPLQEVTPMVRPAKKKSPKDPSVVSMSLSSQIQAFMQTGGHGTMQTDTTRPSDENASLPGGLSRPNGSGRSRVHFADASLHEGTYIAEEEDATTAHAQGNEQREVKENSDPQGPSVPVAKCAGQPRPPRTGPGVFGQREEPVVIHASSGTKNECPQQ